MAEFEFLQKLSVKKIKIKKICFYHRNKLSIKKNNEQSKTTQNKTTEI